MFEELFNQKHEGKRKPADRHTDRPLPCFIIGAAASLADELFVHVPSLGVNERRGPCRWSPRDALLPAGGEAAIMIVDTDGQPWILEWWPYA